MKFLKVFGDRVRRPKPDHRIKNIGSKNIDNRIKMQKTQILFKIEALYVTDQSDFERGEVL